ncbi:MAG: glycosyltransferase family 1 protein [Desemzia incerta]|uniref:glycosyltransferase family 1 protein n=1 Tax=Desemzia incerta TaxID=82801 RepID=UPI00331481A5
MIKVLQVVGSLRLGGLETVAVNYFEHIDRRKYEFTYLVYSEQEGELEKKVRALGGNIIRIDPPSRNYIKFLKNLRRVIREIDGLDIIHAHQSFNSGFVMLIAKLEKVSIRIAHSHTSIDAKNISLTKKIYNSLMRMLILICSTKYVACSTNAGNYLFGKKVFSKSGKVILNSVKIDKFSFDLKKRNELREKFALQGKLVIGHTGTLNSVKNQSFILKIMKHVIKKNRESILILIGDGPDKKLLERQVTQLGIEKNVLFLGLQKNVEDFLMAMDIFIFPSKHEGLGIALIEAQVSGLSCIISDTIPHEAVINKNVRQLSLNNEPEKWALEVTSNMVNDRRNIISEELFQYSPELVAKDLYDIYKKNRE